MKNWEKEINCAELWEIVNNLHDEIIVFDDDYNLPFVNKAAERHYGVFLRFNILATLQRIKVGIQCSSIACGFVGFEV